ncbi:GNAT family N-acetyltransferase [Falsiphaeobacter marinintestinus]|uniref:GNAT family N-acetyltransferase n=1 Tax=Falsiphaeobacter marinintestinus TaxID=1492905 RepID=UPI0011B47111|nr:GNAT family N-acetyltransferase [Phaeobacter marinintestinus]
MTAKPDISLHIVDPQDADALYCLTEYYAELGRRFKTGFDVSLSRDPDADALRPPVGAFLIAKFNDTPIGCAGLKGDGGAIAEVKRVWVAPTARGLGLGRQMMTRIEAQARTLNITTLRLDTNTALPEAITMYKSFGWTEIPRYNDDPYAQVFFEKRL